MIIILHYTDDIRFSHEPDDLIAGLQLISIWKISFYLKTVICDSICKRLEEENNVLPESLSTYSYTIPIINSFEGKYYRKTCGCSEFIFAILRLWNMEHYGNCFEDKFKFFWNYKFNKKKCLEGPLLSNNKYKQKTIWTFVVIADCNQTILL